MFCITMSPEHGDIIKKLGYDPVGLGDKIYTEGHTDKQGLNIAKKFFYGEYTFHYWLWKNKLNNLQIIGLVFVNIENSGLLKY